MVDTERRMELRVPRYYEEDDGCQYSEGKGCLECPWDPCIETLHCRQRNAFLRDLARDGAVAWRREDSTVSGVGG